MGQSDSAQHRILWSKQELSYEDFDRVVSALASIANLAPIDRLDGPYSRIAKYPEVGSLMPFELVFDEDYGLYVRLLPKAGGGQEKLKLLLGKLDEEVASW